MKCSIKSTYIRNWVLCHKKAFNPLLHSRILHLTILRELIEDNLNLLTLSLTTDFRLFQTERVCRQFQI